ncbi:MAG: DUF1007 family protein [Pseudomonadota bacterium]
MRTPGRKETGGRAGFAAGFVWLLSAQVAPAHPHVFVDGGVSFVIGPGEMLEALEVTWRYDEFETLYTLAAFGVALSEQGDLTEFDRQRVVREHSKWPDDFDGSAHLTIDGAPVALDWPKDLDARIVEGRLEVTFRRDLPEPQPTSERAIEVGFYESTYFFAFAVTDIPRLIGAGTACEAATLPFDLDAQGDELVAALEKLALDDGAVFEGIGALVADRIELRCG